MSIDQYLLKVLNCLKDKSIDVFDISMEIAYLYLLPDGAVEFKIANEKEFKYHLSVNDKHYHQYHRNNGITKLAVIVNNTALYLDLNIEGLISVADLLNRAYMRKVYPDLFVLTAIDYLPTNLTQEPRIERFVHYVGGEALSICMALIMPMFVYSIVYDKEKKTLITMKMNGMKMYYFWLANFVFDYLIYWSFVLFFFLIGGIMFGIRVFLETSTGLQLTVYAVWGFSQISMAFFFSCFFSRAREGSSIVLYTFSYLLCVLGLAYSNCCFT